MQRTIRVAACAVACLALTAPLPAREWSPAQTEVWAAVEKCITDFYEGNIEAAYECVHPDLVFWNTGNSVPGDYETARKLDLAWAGGAWLTTTLTPLEILAYEDFAVVYSYVRGFKKAADGGEPIFATERWMEVWKKEGGKWLLVANYGHFE